MNVEELHDRAAWADFTRANGGGILQSFELGELYTKVEHPCLYLVVRDDEGIRLAAMVLRKEMAFGYSYYYCPEGPIVRGGDWTDPHNQVALAAFKRYLRRRARQDHAVYLKLEPHVADDPGRQKTFQELGFARSRVSLQSEHVAHVDISSDEDTVWQNFKKDARYSIRYAERQGVEVIRGRGPWELSLFMKLYQATAKERGFPSRDKDYLEQFRQTLMEDRDLADIFIARHEGEPIAASIVTYYGDEAVYLYAGSAKANQTLYGTYLLQWAAIKEAKRRGCLVYNMTGVAATSDPNDSWAGLRRFKLKFGAEVVDLLGAHDTAFKPALYRLSQTTDVLRKLLRPARAK